MRLIFEALLPLTFRRHKRPLVTLWCHQELVHAFEKFVHSALAELRQQLQWFVRHHSGWHHWNLLSHTWFVFVLLCSWAQPYFVSLIKLRVQRRFLLLGGTSKAAGQCKCNANGPPDLLPRTESHIIFILASLLHTRAEGWLCCRGLLCYIVQS